MTEIEAGELILEDKPWVVCRGCGGTGLAPRQGILQAYEKLVGVWDPRPCVYCKKQKYLLRAAYKSACTLLGIPFPMNPPPLVIHMDVDYKALEERELEMQALHALKEIVNGMKVK